MVKRYRMMPATLKGEARTIVMHKEDEQGGWVAYEDYQKLLLEHQQLSTEYVELKWIYDGLCK